MHALCDDFVMPSSFALLTPRRHPVKDAGYMAMRSESHAANILTELTIKSSRNYNHYSRCFKSYLNSPHNITAKVATKYTSKRPLSQLIKRSVNFTSYDSDPATLKTGLLGNAFDRGNPLCLLSCFHHKPTIVIVVGFRRIQDKPNLRLTMLTLNPQT